MTLTHSGFPEGEHMKVAGFGWGTSLDKLEKSLIVVPQDNRTLEPQRSYFMDTCGTQLINYWRSYVPQYPPPFQLRPARHR